MGIAEESVSRLRAVYPDLGVLARRPVAPRPRDSRLKRLDGRLGQRAAPGGERPGSVVAVRLSIDGVRGGRGIGREARCRYLLIVDVSDLSVGIPPVWIRAPADPDITHVNVWPSTRTFCPWVGAWLPSLCWNTFAMGWWDAPATHRTLGTALEYTKQLLNTENHESPAR